MPSLALLLTAPLQSWGVRSASPRRRDTNTYPTRSGLVGLLAACQGIDRTKSPSWSEALAISVRIDQQGTILRDFHTIGGGLSGHARMRTADGKGRADNAVVTNRYYLADAAFTVAIEGERATLERLADALASPFFTPFLGRKSCPPSMPMLLGLSERSALDVLATLPAYQRMPRSASLISEEVSPVAAEPGTGSEVTFDDLFAAASAAETGRTDDAVKAGQPRPTGPAAPTTVCRVVVENPDYVVESLNDRPVSFDHWHRSWGTRLIGEETVTVPVAGTGLPAFSAMRSALSQDLRFSTSTETI